MGHFWQGMYATFFGREPAAGLVESMADTQLTMDDYLAMVRRRLKVVIVPLLIAPFAGFLVSYAFTPVYKSTSEVLVEGQKVPIGLRAFGDHDRFHAARGHAQDSGVQHQPSPECDGGPQSGQAGDEGKLIEDIRASSTWCRGR